VFFCAVPLSSRILKQWANRRHWSHRFRVFDLQAGRSACKKFEVLAQPEQHHEEEEDEKGQQQEEEEQQQQQQQQQLAWVTVGSWSNVSSGTGACTAHPNVTAVNVSATKDGDVLALALAPTPIAAVNGKPISSAATTNFALCYAKDVATAKACALAAATSVNVGEVMAARNAYIMDGDRLPALADPGEDRFQRRMLSTMKVNTLSLHPHCTLTALSLHSHCTLTVPSLHP
jgi:hypothetical protein